MTKKSKKSKLKTLKTFQYLGSMDISQIDKSKKNDPKLVERNHDYRILLKVRKT